MRNNNEMTILLGEDYGGAKNRSLKGLAPEAEAKTSTPEITHLDVGAASVEADYPAHRLNLVGIG